MKWDPDDYSLTQAVVRSGANVVGPVSNDLAKIPCFRWFYILRRVITLRSFCYLKGIVVAHHETAYEAINFARPAWTSRIQFLTGQPPPS